MCLYVVKVVSLALAHVAFLLIVILNEKLCLKVVNLSIFYHLSEFMSVSFINNLVITVISVQMY